MDIVEHNRRAWNRQSREGSEWAVPVEKQATLAARNGEWSVRLTPRRRVPTSWFGELTGKDVLCLASGGGQQAPVLAASGAHVVSFDLSDEQLDKDRLVAERDGLALQCVQGDMADLSAFPPECFDLIFHPVSNVFVPNVEVVWRECHRVLRATGVLLAGFMNPSYYLFDHEDAEETGELKVKFKLPYAEPDSLDAEGIRVLEESGRALEFSHSLEDQIGGQIKAGFVISELYEDFWTDRATPLNAYSPTYIATRATKPPPKKSQR